MTRVAVEIGRFEVETWLDYKLIRIMIRDRERNSELTGLLPEDVIDLIYALDRVQVQISPLVTDANKP